MCVYMFVYVYVYIYVHFKFLIILYFLSMVLTQTLFEYIVIWNYTDKNDTMFMWSEIEGIIF